MSEPLKATVKLVDGMLFVGESGTGHAVVMDTSPASGGGNTGPSPMELVLTALGGCTGMDVVSILRKKKVLLSGLQVNVTGHRDPGPDVYPKVYKEIEVEFVVTGRDISKEAVRHAVELSETKYCSVMANLRGVSKIKTSYRIINE